jgi:hypothetical protein
MAKASVATLPFSMIGGKGECVRQPHSYGKGSGKPCHKWSFLAESGEPIKITARTGHGCLTASPTLLATYPLGSGPSVRLRRSVTA